MQRATWLHPTCAGELGWAIGTALLVAVVVFVIILASRPSALQEKGKLHRGRVGAAVAISAIAAGALPMRRWVTSL